MMDYNQDRDLSNLLELAQLVRKRPAWDKFIDRDALVLAIQDIVKQEFSKPECQIIQ